jgi:hypothetical protein
MRKLSTLLLIVVAGCFFSFRAVDSTKVNTVVGLWSSGKTKDVALHGLTFAFSENGFKVYSENADNVVATGTLAVVREEVLVATEPFVNEDREVIYLAIDSMSGNVTLPKMIKVKELSRSRMVICYERGASNCYVTLRRVKALK